MSENEKFQVAKQYIDKQLATMKEYGCAPKELSPSEYKSMVQQAAKAIAR